jgi:hypothetical protein
MPIRLLFILLCYLPTSAWSQNHFTGTWEMHLPEQNTHLTLEIAEPERQLLYPARLSIQCDSFQASYHVYFAKHHSRQIVFSRNKYPEFEKPFSLGNMTALLNGSLLFSKDLKGQPQLATARTLVNRLGFKATELTDFLPQHRPLAQKIQTLLASEEWILSKKDKNPWKPASAAAILPVKGGPYYGVSDTLFVAAKTGTVHFNKNRDNDIISLQVNGGSVVDQVDSKKERDDEDILLDTGLNLICFFADDFGRSHPSGASVVFQVDNTSIPMDFNASQNLAANFIALRIFRRHADEDETRFSSFDPNDPQYKNAFNKRPPTVGKTDTVFKRENKPIGNLLSRSAELTFAIWDDAVEDGDTISICINDRWIVKGFPVLKKAQFIKVKLDPGPNLITFIAENLGSIIPNTTVLEIVDGNKRKSFHVETDMDMNNQIKVLYDLR